MFENVEVKSAINISILIVLQNWFLWIYLLIDWIYFYKYFFYFKGKY